MKKNILFVFILVMSFSALFAQEENYLVNNKIITISFDKNSEIFKIKFAPFSEKSCIELKAGDYFCDQIMDALANQELLYDEITSRKFIDEIFQKNSHNFLIEKSNSIKPNYLIVKCHYGECWLLKDNYCEEKINQFKSQDGYVPLPAKDFFNFRDVFSKMQISIKKEGATISDCNSDFFLPSEKYDIEKLDAYVKDNPDKASKDIYSVYKMFKKENGQIGEKSSVTNEIDLFFKTTTPLTSLWGTLCSVSFCLLNTFNNVAGSSFCVGTLIPKDTKIIVVGDLHGDLQTLKTLCYEWIKTGILKKDFSINKDYCFVFLGDYADRGDHGTEVFDFILRLFLKNTHRVFLLRGNHEFDVMMNYDQPGKTCLMSEIKKKAKLEAIEYSCVEGIEKMLCQLFDRMAENLVLAVDGTKYKKFLHFAHATAPITKSNKQIILTNLLRYISGSNIPYQPHIRKLNIDVMNSSIWGDVIADAPSTLFKVLEESNGTYASSRGFDKNDGLNIRTLSKSFMNKFFEENASKDTFEITASIFGHAHRYGISLLKDKVTYTNDMKSILMATELVEKIKELSWDMLKPNTTFNVKPNSVFTCLASPIQAGSEYENVAYMTLSYNNDKWYVTHNSAKRLLN